MNKTFTTAKKLPDGRIRITDPGGSQRIAKPKKLRRLTEKEAHEAALSDPDARPWTKEQLRRVKLVPRVKTLRRTLQLSQQEFARLYRIPLGTLRDWEQGKCEPDQAAKAYLAVIAQEPETVRKALAKERVANSEL